MRTDINVARHDLHLAVSEAQAERHGNGHLPQVMGESVCLPLLRPASPAQRLTISQMCGAESALLNSTCGS
jgi:hypothetical protein